MGGRVISLVTFFMLLGISHIESVLIAFHSNGITDAVAYGTIDPESGRSSVINTLYGLRETNTDQFAYNDKNNYFTFVAFDAGTYSPLMITIDGQKGVQLMNTTIPYGPVPFGFHYDSVLSQLIGQSWNANGTGYIVRLDSTKSAVTSYLRNFLTGSFSFISSTLDQTKHLYYFTYLVSSPTAINQSLYTYDYNANTVVSNVTISIPDAANPITHLAFSNTTSTLYGMMYSSSAKSVDVLSINPQNGQFQFLNVFTNNTYGIDIKSLAVDPVTNILYVIFEQIPPVLVTVNLGTKRIQSSVEIQGVPLQDMLFVV